MLYETCYSHNQPMTTNQGKLILADQKTIKELPPEVQVNFGFNI